MLLGDVAGDGEAEAGAAGRRRAGVVDAGEALEDALALGRGDAGAVVGDGEHDLGRRARTSVNADRRRRRGGRRCRPGCRPTRASWSRIAEHAARRRHRARSTCTRSSARSRRATRSTMSSRSTGSRRRSPTSPSSARATSSRSSARRWSPMVSSSTLAWVASRSACVGVGEVDLELGADAGERAAQLVGARRRRTAAGARPASSTRSSMSFIVRARRAISSSPGGTGTRRSRSRPPIAATSARIASTGRSVRPTSHQSTHGQRRPRPAGSRRAATRRGWRCSRRCRRAVPPTMIASIAGVRDRARGTALSSWRAGRRCAISLTRRRRTSATGRLAVDVGAWTRPPRRRVDHLGDRVVLAQPGELAPARPPSARRSRRRRCSQRLVERLGEQPALLHDEADAGQHEHDDHDGRRQQRDPGPHA